MSSTGEVKDAMRLAQQYNIDIYKMLINGLMNSSLRVTQLKVELEEYNRSSMKFYARLYEIRDSKIPFASVREQQIGLLRDQVKRNDRLKQEVHSIQRSLWNMREMGQRVPMANRHIIEQHYPELCVKNRSDQVPLTVLCDQVIRKYNLRQEKHIRAMLKWAEEVSNSRKATNPVPKSVVQRNQLLPTPKPTFTPPQPAKPDREAAYDVTPVNSNENISLDPNDGFAISPDDIRELDFKFKTTRRKAVDGSLADNHQRSLSEVNTKPDSDKTAQPILVEKDEWSSDVHVNFGRPYQLFTWEELMLGFKRSERQPAQVGPSWSSAEPIAQPHQPEFVPEVRQWPIKITSVGPRSRPVKPKSVAEPGSQPNKSEYIPEPRPYLVRSESTAVPIPRPPKAEALYRLSQPAQTNAAKPSITQYLKQGDTSVQKSKAPNVEAVSQITKSKGVSKSQLSNTDVLSLWKSRLTKTVPVSGAISKSTSGIESGDKKNAPDAALDKQRIMKGQVVTTGKGDGLTKSSGLVKYVKYATQTNTSSNKAIPPLVGSDHPHVYENKIKRTGHSDKKSLAERVGSEDSQINRRREEQLRQMELKRQRMKHMLSQKMTVKHQRVKSFVHDKNVKDTKSKHHSNKSSTSVPPVKGLGSCQSFHSGNRKRPASSSDSEPSAKRSKQEPGIVLRLFKKQSSWNVKQVFDRD